MKCALRIEWPKGTLGGCGSAIVRYRDRSSLWISIDVRLDDFTVMDQISSNSTSVDNRMRLTGFRSCPSHSRYRVTLFFAMSSRADKPCLTLIDVKPWNLLLFYSSSTNIATYDVITPSHPSYQPTSLLSNSSPTFPPSPNPHPNQTKRNIQCHPRTPQPSPQTSSANSSTSTTSTTK